MQRNGQPIAALEADPWETHAALTAAERDLLGNLRTQRGVVMQANEQVERLERSRMACWSRLVSALLQTYAAHSGIPTGGAFKPLEQLQRAPPPHASGFRSRDAPLVWLSIMHGAPACCVTPAAVTAGAHACAQSTYVAYEFAGDSSQCEISSVPPCGRG